MYIKWLLLFAFSINFALANSVERQLEKIEEKYNLPEQKYEYHQEILNVLKKNPLSVDAHLAYITNQIYYLDQSESIRFEYEQIYKNKATKLNQYLLLKIKYMLVGWGPKSINEKAIILADIKKLQGVKSLTKYVLLDLVNYTIDTKEKLKYAKALIKKFPNDEKSKKSYAVSLMKAGDFDQVIKVCKETLNSKKPDYSICHLLARVQAEPTKEQEAEVEKLKLELIKVIDKDLSVKELRGFYFFFRFLKNWDQVERIAEIILGKDKDWVPMSYLKEMGYVTKYSDQADYEKINEAKKILDIKERIIKLQELTHLKFDNSKLQGAIYHNLARAYENPAVADKLNEISSLEKAIEIDPDNIEASQQLAKRYIESVSNIKKAIGLLDKILHVIDKDLKEAQSWYPNQKEWVDYSKKKLVEIYYYKGKAYYILGDMEMSYNMFQRSFVLNPNSDAAFFIGDIKMNENEILDALNWYVYAFTKNKFNNIKPTIVSKKKDELKEIIAANFNEKLTLDQLVNLKKKELDNLDDGSEVKEEEHPLLGKKSIPLGLNDVHGNKFDWTSLKGKKVILSFWATWCSPCIQELPVLNKMSKELKDKNVQVIAVCTDGITQAKKVKKIAKKSKLDLTILLSSSDVRGKYQFTGIPSLFLINEKGNIIDYHSGYSSEMESIVKEKLFSK
jgi:thiol-disulfide isomerase/thioredoxin